MLSGCNADVLVVLCTILFVFPCSSFYRVSALVSAYRSGCQSASTQALAQAQPRGPHSLCLAQTPASSRSVQLIVDFDWHLHLIPLVSTLCAPPISLQNSCLSGQAESTGGVTSEPTDEMDSYSSAGLSSVATSGSSLAPALLADVGARGSPSSSSLSATVRSGRSNRQILAALTKPMPPMPVLLGTRDVPVSLLFIGVSIHIMHHGRTTTLTVSHVFRHGRVVQPSSERGRWQPR